MYIPEQQNGHITGSVTLAEVEAAFSPYDLKRLDLYSRNMADHHLITDLLPACEFVFHSLPHLQLHTVARIHFSGRTFHLSAAQNVRALLLYIILCMIVCVTGHSVGTWATAQNCGKCRGKNSYTAELLLRK